MLRECVSLSSPLATARLLRVLSAHAAAGGGVLRRALLACAGEASLAVVGALLRCGAALPERAELDALDVLCALLDVVEVRECGCSGASVAAAAAALAAAAAAPVWRAVGGGAAPPPGGACGCSSAAAVRAAYFGLGARLLAAADALEPHVAGLLGRPAALADAGVGGGGAPPPPGALPLAALAAALEEARSTRFAPLSPLLSSPAEAALHLLHAAARVGGGTLARTCAGAPPALYSALCALLADARARVPLRAAAARLLYLASGAGGGGSAALRVSGAPALALAFLLPHAPGRGSERSRVARAGLRRLMALTLRNLLTTLSGGVGDGGKGGVDPAPRPGAPHPPPLPEGNALPAQPRRPCAAQAALWAALTEAALASVTAADAFIALLSHTAVGGGAATLVECNPPALENFLVALLAREDAGFRPAARRAAPLLWRLAAERGRATSALWAGAMAAWLPWRGGQVKRLREREAEAPSEASGGAGGARYDWEASGSPWTRHYTAVCGWPYFFHAPSQRSQWALPTSAMPPSRAPHGVAVVEAPLEADEEGLTAVLALAESGCLGHATPPWWWEGAGEDTVVACVAAVVGEGCAEMPPGAATPTGGFAPAGAFTHWPHLPLSSSGCHYGGVPPQTPRLTVAACAAKAFLARAVARLGAGPPLHERGGAPDGAKKGHPASPPLPLWLRPAFAASLRRLASSSLLPLPAALSLTLVSRFCAEPAAVGALCAALAEVGEQEEESSLFAQASMAPPLPMNWERGAPGLFHFHAGTGVAEGVGEEEAEAEVARHACVASQFVDAKDGSLEPLPTDVGKALPEFSAGTPWQHAWEAEGALSQRDFLAAAAPML